MPHFMNLAQPDQILGMGNDSSLARTVADQKCPDQIGLVWWWRQETSSKSFNIIVLKTHF